VWIVEEMSDVTLANTFFLADDKTQSIPPFSCKRLKHGPNQARNQEFVSGVRNDNFSLKSEGNNTDVEAPHPGCKPKLDINCKLVPQI